MSTSSRRCPKSWAARRRCRTSIAWFASPLRARRASCSSAKPVPGKELIAKAVHRLSRRSDGPFIRVNCGALHENLLESELFGHIKGAFTGAVENKTGRFEAAHGGTIFLDEINSTSPKLQVKLLRVLHEREFERVGESRTIRVDVRVIAATNASLEDLVADGRVPRRPLLPAERRADRVAAPARAARRHPAPRPVLPPPLRRAAQVRRPRPDAAR